jgi:hypothetical protein
MYQASIRSVLKMVLLVGVLKDVIPDVSSVDKVSKMRMVTARAHLAVIPWALIFRNVRRMTGR